MKILIVDDEPEIGELLSYNFRKKGFEVTTAKNGCSGIDSAREFHPDLIILDIMMPVMNGIEMCAELKKDSELESIPVLFLSATNNESLIRSALDAGGETFISKPVHLNLLIEIVTRMHEKKVMKQAD